MATDWSRDGRKGQRGKGVAIGAFVAAVLVLGVLALPAGAGAQAPAPGPSEPVYTPAQASTQLDQALGALTSDDPAAADPTNELRHLAAALPGLQGAERRRARAILARPPASDGAGLDDAGGVEPFGAEWSPAATLTRQQYKSPGGGFIVHYVTITDDAPSLADGSDPGVVPDYVEQAAARSDQSQAVENGVLGWPAPKSDGAKGGGSGVTDVYLSDICEPGSCLFGYAAPDDRSDQCRRPPFQCSSYLVLDDDYSVAEFDYPDPDIPLSVTVAHEYNHVLQFTIDAMQDAWMFESTAVWAEEHVFPDANDWLFFVKAWARQPHEPITDFSAGGGLRVYGSAVWNHWLERSLGGPGVVLDAWLRSREPNPRDFAVGAYGLAIKQHGGAGFSQAFSAFATSTAEWRASGDLFPDEDSFPDVRRHDRLRRGTADRMTLDHTAYRLYSVQVGGADTVTFRAHAPRGVRSAIALVGRDGSAEDGTTLTQLRYLKRGGRDSVTLGGMQAFERVTAIVVNADGRVRGRRYSRDNERFRVSLR